MMMSRRGNELDPLCVETSLYDAVVPNLFFPWSAPYRSVKPTDPPHSHINTKT